MPRIRREKSKSGYYHIMLRGNEKKAIFLKEEDMLRFLEITFKVRDEHHFYLIAYCLMDNHLHLMIKEDREDIAGLMKRITVSYVKYFNNKYNRVGHLFQDRFKSESVNDENYALALSRYIHLNPVKAGLVAKPDDYRWSSYRGYLNSRALFADELYTDVILGMFSDNLQRARELYVEFMGKSNDIDFMDLDDDKEADKTEFVKEVLNRMILERGLSSDILYSEIPAEILAEYKKATKLSLRKIAEITGINKDKLSRILRECAANSK